MGQAPSNTSGSNWPQSSGPNRNWVVDSPHEVPTEFSVRTGRNVIGIMGTVQPHEGRRKRLLAGTRPGDVVERIRRRPAERRSVEALAELADMSTRQLGRHIHTVPGMSPRDFMKLCRLQRACEQLLQPDRSISEIAMDTHFF